jgi:CheY-like chemotaxis protein
MDGSELGRQIRSVAGDITLIALTGKAGKYGRDSALAAGFDYYFAKPADTVQLLGLLASLFPVQRMVA